MLPKRTQHAALTRPWLALGIQIDVADFRFAESGGRTPVPLGTAEDCFGHGMRNCE